MTDDIINFDPYVGGNVAIAEGEAAAEHGRGLHPRQVDGGARSVGRAGHGASSCRSGQPGRSIHLCILQELNSSGEAIPVQVQFRAFAF
jgi:hypothetical protein